MATHGPKVVLKAEYSSSGLGVRVCVGRPAAVPDATAPSFKLDEADEQWVRGCLQRDGVLTAEPWLEVLAELSGEWLDGVWCGVSCHHVPNMRWAATLIEEPSAQTFGGSAELFDFIFVQNRV